MRRFPLSDELFGAIAIAKDESPATGFFARTVRCIIVERLWV
jgi:hypothetical protein